MHEVEAIRQQHAIVGTNVDDDVPRRAQRRRLARMRHVREQQTELAVVRHVDERCREAVAVLNDDKTIRVLGNLEVGERVWVCVFVARRCVSSWRDIMRERRRGRRAGGADDDAAPDIMHIDIMAVAFLALDAPSSRSSPKTPISQAWRQVTAIQTMTTEDDRLSSGSETSDDGDQATTSDDESSR